MPAEPTGTVIGGWHRGFGLALELLAREYAYGIMSYVADGPRSPAEIAQHLQRVHVRLKDLIKDPGLTQGAIYNPLRGMVEDGLLRKAALRNSFPPQSLYQLTGMARELLDSMGALGDFGAQHYDYLVDRIRKRDRIDPKTPLPVEEAGTADEIIAVRRRRHSIGMALGLFRSRRFCFGMLTSISEGRRTTSDWLKRERAAIKMNKVTTGSRSMNEMQFYRNLHWLVDCEMVETRSIRSGRGHQETWAWATPLGYEYLEAVRRIGECALGYSDELVDVLRRRRKLGARSGSESPA